MFDSADAEVMMDLQRRVRESLSDGGGGSRMGGLVADGDATALFEGYIGGMNGSSYILRVTKHCACCEYSFLEVVKKQAPLAELYRNVELTLGRSGNDGGMVLFFVRSHAPESELVGEEVVFVPRCATRTLEDFMKRGGVPWLPRAVYPVPEKTVYQLFLYESLGSG